MYNICFVCTCNAVNMHKLNLIARGPGPNMTIISIVDKNRSLSIKFDINQPKNIESW